MFYLDENVDGKYSFQIAKVQSQGVASHLLGFLLTKVLVIKKRVFSLTCESTTL